jgi:hypothetical protein
MTHFLMRMRLSGGSVKSTLVAQSTIGRITR